MPDHCRRSSWGHRWSAFRAARVWRKGFFPFSVPHCTSPSLPSAISKRNLRERKESAFGEGRASSVHFNVGHQILEALKCSTWEDKMLMENITVLYSQKKIRYVCDSKCLIWHCEIYSFILFLPIYTPSPVLSSAINCISWEKYIYIPRWETHIYIQS